MGKAQNTFNCSIMRMIKLPLGVDYDISSVANVGSVDQPLGHRNVAISLVLRHYNKQSAANTSCRFSKVDSSE